MAVTCWIPNCRHNNFSHTCKFFKIPKDPKIRNKWLKLIRHVIEPKPYSAVCSCHFPEGKKENGPQNVPNNIKIRDKFSAEPLTELQHSQMDVVPPSTEFCEIEDLFSAQSSTSQGFETIIKTETSTECYENEDISSDQPSTPQSFEIILKTEKPEEFYKIEESSSENIQMDLAIYTSSNFHQIEDRSSVQPSTSNKTLSKSNNLVNNSKPAPSFGGIALLEAENYFLKKELEEAKLLRRATFSYDQLSENKELVSLYTGLPNALVFNALYELVENIPIKYRQGWKVEILSRKDQLFMTLMKIRQHFPNGDLAYRFNVSKGAVTNVVLTWFHVLHKILLDQLTNNENIMPSTNKNKVCFISTFTNCKFVSNCAEIVTALAEKSTSMQKQTLEPISIKVLGKLWTELHQMPWTEKKNADRS